MLPGRVHAVRYPEPQARLVHQAGILALEVVIPEPDDLAQKIHLGARRSLMRIKMRPRPHPPLPRAVQAFRDPDRRVAETIAPAAEVVDRTVDGFVVLRDRPPPPHAIMELMTKPERGPEAHRLEPFFP